MKQTTAKTTGQAKEAGPTRNKPAEPSPQEPLHLLLQRATSAPNRIDPAQAARLQRAIGNRAVGGLTAGPGQRQQAPEAHAAETAFQHILHNQARIIRRATDSRVSSRETFFRQADPDPGHTSQCNCGACTGSDQASTETSPIIQRHAEGEEVAQAKRVVGPTPTVSIKRQTNGAVARAKQKSGGAPVTIQHRDQPEAAIQRHAAFEHYLLGQVSPSDLASIPMVREIPELQKEKDRLEAMKRQYRVEPARLPDITARLNQARAKVLEAKHTIEQEMDRLVQWKDDPEAAAGRIGEKGKVSKAADGTWNVPIVVLPCRDGEIVVSYSEMNTMPDLFGNPEAIADTPKAQVLSLLQGVRQQSYIELDNLYKEIFGASRSVLHRKVPVGIPFTDIGTEVDTGTEGDFQGAKGPRSQAVVDKAYEIRTESQVNTATTRKGEEYEQYFAALERNACHFAPESWSQWEGYHRKARDLAQRAARQRDIARLARGINDVEADKAEALADDLGNQALVQNSFGEHYLQDSFASGHLIDKTKIMQWFMTWLNANNDGLGSLEKAKAEWAMISTLSDQDLASNPQRLHDKMRRGELDSVEDATAEVGLEAKPEIVFMMWWRDAAYKNKKFKHLTAATAAENFNLRGDYKLRTNMPRANQLMELLVSQGFAKRKTEGIIHKTSVYSLNEIHIEALKNKTSGAYDASMARRMRKSQKHHGTERDFVKEAHEFNLAAYKAFMSNAYVQASTKFFHDKFCKAGLTVNARNGDEIGKIYGDNNMLRGGGQAGVKYSAETSAMSREAIFNTLGGTGDQIPAVTAISNRFPGSVIVDGTPVSLVNWNQNLKQQGEAGLFKEAKDNGALLVYKLKTGISDKGALDMDKLTENIGTFTPHDQTPF